MQERRTDVGLNIPWNKGIPRTPEEKIKMSMNRRGKCVGSNNPFYGKKHSQKTIEKIRNARKKYTGCNHPLFGKHHSEETKRKISLSHIGKVIPDEVKLKLSKAKKGIKFTEEHKRKISKAQKGEKAYWYGKKMAEEVRIKIGNAHRGEKSVRWKGGISFEPYPSLFNRQLKEKIRVRDNFKCQICGIPELECNERLTIHHIDYNKKNCNIGNLISLCRKCHTRTNLNREFWMAKFKEEQYVK